MASSKRRRIAFRSRGKTREASRRAVSPQNPQMASSEIRPLRSRYCTGRNWSPAKRALVLWNASGIAARAASCLLRSGQERFHTGAQPGIIPADLIQELRPLLGVAFLQGLGEHGFFGVTHGNVRVCRSPARRRCFQLGRVSRPCSIQCAIGAPNPSRNVFLQWGDYLHACSEPLSRRN